MKAALILGVQIYTGVTFEKVIEPTTECGWKCQVDPPFHPASQLELDMIVGADGKKNVLPDFPQIEMRGRNMFFKKVGLEQLGSLKVLAKK
jgi:hypothetical protein